VAVDVRQESPTFGQWVGVRMSADDFTQLYIPPGFAHGFSVTSDVAQVAYKCTDYYDPGGERGLIWNDPDIAVAWPDLGEPLLSERDRNHPRLRELFGRPPSR
jgi:dTDP-4-dehydrorhamnose 3,5-epimerase